MLRKTLTILSLIGLLLSVGLWGVSKFQFTFEYCGHWLGLIEGDIVWCDQTPAPIGSWSWSWLGMEGSGTFFYTIAGAASNRIQGRWWPSANSSYVCVPIYWLAMLFVILPVFDVLGLNSRRKRRKRGLCLNCGYNLKGLTEPRCPECNTPFDEHLLEKDT